MKVAVLSPLSKQGRTTISILLGHALAYMSSLEVCVTYLGLQSNMPKYLGVSELTEDKTRSTSQIIKLIESGGFTPEELVHYMISLDRQFKLLNTSTELTQLKDSEALISYISSIEDYNTIRIIDVDTELTDQSTQELIEASDLVVMVIDQTMESAEYIKNFKEDIEVAHMFPPDTKTIYIVNKFNPLIMSHRDTSKMYGIRHRKTSKVNYEPRLVKMANNGRLDETIRLIHKGNLHLLGLDQDVTDLARIVGNNLGIQVNWRELN